jgi:Rox3 mediator complex subunit
MYLNVLSPRPPQHPSETHHGRRGAGDLTAAMDPDTSQPPAQPAPVTADPPLATTSSVKPEAPSEAVATASSESTDVSKARPQATVLRFEAPLLFGQKRKLELPIGKISTDPLISTEVPFSQPHHSQDLIGRYGVTPTAAKVARTDPVTGEKINKLRSSYQNHIKAFQIAGRNKPIKHEDVHHGMSLRDIAAWPEEEWRNQKVASKEVSKGLSNTTLAKVDKAVKLEPGPVPKNDEWENILGHEKPKPTVSPNELDVKAGAQERRSGKVNGHMNGPSAGENEITRARRTGKRRRYDDDSFEGYGEGYVDDDRDDVDSSDGGTKKKRRRKVR